MMSNKQYFKNIRSEAEDKYSNASGDKGLNWSGAAINVVAVTALGAVVGALVSKKGKVQAAKVGGSIGFLLGFVGGFQVLTRQDSKKA